MTWLAPSPCAPFIKRPMLNWPGAAELSPEGIAGVSVGRMNQLPPEQRELICTYYRDLSRHDGEGVAQEEIP